MNIGFVGLGRMGLPMTKLLIEAGHTVYVNNRSQQKVRDMTELGAIPTSSMEEITQHTEVVMTCLPDVKTVEEIYLSESGLIANTKPGQILIDHSTVGIKTTNLCADGATQAGASFLDAPISGGTERATNGTLTIMCGGDETSFAKVLPLLEILGQTVQHVGATGSGTAVKLVNQLLVGIHSLAAAEALLLGAKAGADPQQIFDLVNTGWGQSFMLARNSEVMISRQFEGDRAQLRVILKDLGLIKELAETVDSSIPLGDLTLKRFIEAAESGLDDLDPSAILLPLEDESNYKIH
ncbi:MAG: NAD(P)-dependent oxidoreductase [Dehalococcoidia bacterium]|mgnify:CR=1 FL=1|tara:strand:+ start:7249 stop:8133 length:885 start_codon:yes stop_codon:yes gene_type:complete